MSDQTNTDRPSTPSRTDELKQRISDILGEPATGSRGQGGLPVHGTVVDYEMSFTKDGKQYLVDKLYTLLTATREEAGREAKISVLTKLAGKTPPPKWSENYHPKYNDGFKAMKAKVKFELQRLKKLRKSGESTTSHPPATEN